MLPGPDDATADGVLAERRAPTLTWPFWVLALGVVVADQITKMLVLAYVPLFDARTLIPGLLDIVHIQNAGVAFGIFNDMAHPGRSLMTTLLALAALGGIAYYARHIRPEERVARLGIGLIMGGAIGNLIDRFRHGHVIDFIDFYVGGWHFWAFNIADASISIGAALVFIELLFLNRHASNPV